MRQFWRPRPASPGDPVKVSTDTQKLENGTALTWDPAPGDVDHYEVASRETMAPDRQFDQDVAARAGGAAVIVILPISKDNVIFGIRAVDPAGHRGMVVVP